MWVVISGAPYYNPEAEIIGSIGIHLDITYQKDLQSELKKAKEEAEVARFTEKEFLAQMSHEIRTPLNAVVGMANLLGTTQLTDDQREIVRDINYGASVLNSLISDILDLSKIESGKLELAKSVVKLNFLIGVFLNNIGNDIKQLKGYLKQAKLNELRGLVHRLKPSFTMLGSPQTSERFTDFENAIRHKDAMDKKDKAAVEKLIEEVVELLPHVKNLKTSLSNYLED